MHDACAALGVPIVTRKGFEADDVIGSLAARSVAAGLDVAIGMTAPSSTGPGSGRSSGCGRTRSSTSSL